MKIVIKQIQAGLQKSAFLLFCTILLWSSSIQAESWQAVEAKPLPAFLLFNDDFEPIRNIQLEGRWTLLFFGYMNCPDVCPMTLQTLATVMQKLREDHTKQLPQVIFVSIDPWRDTPDKLKSYVRYFDETFTAASADEPQLNILTNFFKVIYYNNRSPDLIKDYEVAHSDGIIVVNPRGQYIGYFKSPMDSEEISEKLKTLLSELP